MQKLNWPNTRSNLLNYQNFYLVGIKGVAMTSIAQCLLDAGKQVAGCDIAEKFVTQKMLDSRSLKIDFGFKHHINQKIDCLIYTSAHGSNKNPLVKQAQKNGLIIFSQAEALASMFNQKQGIAICGVGGKSTISAMISFILEKNSLKPSFSVGVGEIIGLNKTGAWHKTSKYFVAEADEYVINPQAREEKKAIIPRFAFLKPWIVVCNSLKYDHPDVYDNFEHTKQIFWHFFKQIKNNGYLIFNANDNNLADMATKLKKTRPDIHLISFGENLKKADFNLLKYEISNQKAIAQFTFNNKSYNLELKIPGKFNAQNALAAIATVSAIDVNIKSISTLKNFASTKRRFEFIGEKNDVLYWDDYAHHPSEIAAVVEAVQTWHPNKKIIFAFQSHTYSRTKQLFNDFVDAFGKANEVVMINIFASARENFDPAVSSDLLCEAIQKKYSQVKCINLKNLTNLANFCNNKLKPGNVFITLGAGDIYKVHELIDV